MVDLPGLLVLAIAVVASAWVAFRALSYRRAETFMTSLLRTAFLPEKRRATLWLLAIEGSAVLLSGTVAALLRLGVLGVGAAEAVSAGLDIVAISAVVGLCELGLSRGVLTEEQRRELRRETPDLLRSLAFMAAAPSPPETPSPPRTDSDDEDFQFELGRGRYRLPASPPGSGRHGPS